MGRGYSEGPHNQRTEGMSMRHLKKVQCEFCGSIGVEGVLSAPHKQQYMGLRRICRGCLSRMYNGKVLYVQYPHDLCTCGQGTATRVPCQKCGAKKVPQRVAYRVKA